MNKTTEMNLPHPLYRVELVKQGNLHFYDAFWKDGSARYPGVTGFLSIISKPALVPWAKREALSLVEAALIKRLDDKASRRVVLNKNWIAEILQDAKKRPDQIKDEAADLGSQAHAFIDLIVRREEPREIPEQIQTPVEAFKNWWKSSGIEFVAGDTKVASREHGFGGSLDALGLRNGRYVIIDFKTSNGIYKEYALQVSAYAQALKETYGIECHEAVIVRFSKKPPVEFEKKPIANLDFSFQAFLAAKSLKEALEKEHFVPF